MYENHEGIFTPTFLAIVSKGIGVVNVVAATSEKIHCVYTYVVCLQWIYDGFKISVRGYIRESIAQATPDLMRFSQDPRVDYRQAAFALN